MTDREVYEYLYLRYAKDDSAEEIAAWEKQQAAAEVAFEAKPLEQRKAEFWAMCREFDCPEDEIQGQWEAYLRG